MTGFGILKIVGVFLGTFILEVIWTFYIRRTSSGDRAQAAIFAGLTFLVGGFVIISYVDNPWYLIPATLGGFCGAWATITYDKRKRNTAL